MADICLKDRSPSTPCPVPRDCPDSRRTGPCGWSL